eukprot:IDg5882t1
MMLQQAEKAFISSYPSISLNYGDKVLVYSDTTKRWEPSSVVPRNENTILVLKPDGDTQPYSINRPQLQLDTRTGNPTSSYDQTRIVDLQDSDIDEIMFFDNGENQAGTPDEPEYELL